MEYQKNRERRVSIFEDTIQSCERNKRLLEAIADSREKTKVYHRPLDELMRQPDVRYSDRCQVTFSKQRSLEAAQMLHGLYQGSRIGILNFASATNPGGGVVRGSNAQEECLCRCSTLYPCLNTDYLQEEYYDFHRQKHDTLYSDTCIYIPQIIKIKTDDEWPEWTEEENWFFVDVISCAAPNLRAKSSGCLNLLEGGRGSISNGELQSVLEKRIRGILHVAESHEVDVLVLGAFGCGAFCNSPHMVAKAFRKELEGYAFSFRVVHFAIFCASKEDNYASFTSVFQ